MTEEEKQTKPKKPKIFVLDTSVIIDDPEIFYNLGDSISAIPMVVIRELDGHKNSEKEHVARAAREVGRTLDRLSSYADLTAGVTLPHGGTLMVVTEYDVIDDLASDADNKVVGTALKLKREHAGRITVLTTDGNMRSTARIRGLKAEFYPFGMDYDLAMRLREEYKAAKAITQEVSAEEYVGSPDKSPVPRIAPVIARGRINGTRQTRGSIIFAIRDGVKKVLEGLGLS